MGSHMNMAARYDGFKLANDKLAPERENSLLNLFVFDTCRAIAS